MGVQYPHTLYKVGVRVPLVPPKIMPTQVRVSEDGKAVGLTSFLDRGQFVSSGRSVLVKEGHVCFVDEQVVDVLLNVADRRTSPRSTQLVGANHSLHHRPDALQPHYHAAVVVHVHAQCQPVSRLHDQSHRKYEPAARRSHNVGDYSGNERVPIRLASCRFPGLVISKAKILLYFFK